MSPVTKKPATLVVQPIRRQTLEVAVAKAGGGEFAARDRLKERDVGPVTNAESATSAAVLDHGTGNVIEDVGEGRGVVDGRERVEVIVVGALGDPGATVQVGDALAEGLPGELAVELAVSAVVDGA